MYYEYSTNNQSFLKIKHRLKKIFVKNNDFMLAIFNKDLIGIDPYIDLTNSQKVLIYKECKYNPWYFFRNIAKIPRFNDSIITFDLNLLNLSMLYLYSIKSFNISMYVIGPRKSYKKTTCLLLGLYNSIFEGDVEFYCKDEYDKIQKEKYFESLKKLLPEYLMVHHKVSFLTEYDEKKSKRTSLKIIFDAEFNKNTLNIIRTAKGQIISVSTINDNFRDCTKIICHDYYAWNMSNFDSYSLYENYNINLDYRALDNPEEYYNFMCKILDNDCEVIRREILCERKENNFKEEPKMKIAGKFVKVSYEQFKKDWYDTFGTYISEDSIKTIWENIKLPKRATKGSAGYDFFSPIEFCIEPGKTLKIPTGIRVRMNEGWALKLYPRSGLGFNYRLQIDNTVGIIDQDYYFSDNEGHIFVKITNDSKQEKNCFISAGSGFIQGIFIEFGITEDDDTDGIRNGGFGSTTTETRMVEYNI